MKQTIRKKKTGNKLFNIVPKPFKWSIHNVIAHPLSEVFFVGGYLCIKKFDRGDRLVKLGNWIHDVTIPYHSRGTGRG